jgi:hypothetical protein
LLRQFREAFAETIVRRSSEPGADVWPAPIVNPFEINALSHRPVLTHLGRVLDAAWQNFAEPAARLAEHERYPSRLTQLAYLFLERPDTSQEGAHRRQTAERLIRVVAHLRSGDPFCVSGNRLAWITSGELSDLHQKIHQQPVTTSCRELAFRLSTLIELEYMALVAFGREIHGPYIGRNGRLLFRDFHNLRPQWWAFPKQLPFQAIRIIYLYDPRVSISFDFVGRVVLPTNLYDGLMGCALQIDDGPVWFGEELPVHLQALLPKVDLCMRDGVKEVGRCGPTDLAARWVRSQFAAIGNLALSVGLPELPESWENLSPEGAKTSRSWIPKAMAALGSLSPASRTQEIARLLDPGDPEKGRWLARG